LLASSWTTNLGDGIAIAAGPLLVAAQTSDAFLVAMAALLQWLPRLLFGLAAGVLSDRLDRRDLIMAVNALRAVILAALATTIVTGTISIAIALAALFLLGTAEVFADNTSSTLLPMLVQRDDLAVANARLQTATSSYRRRTRRDRDVGDSRWESHLPRGERAVGLIILSRLAVRRSASPHTSRGRHG
jgi:MFS family permease